MSFVVSHSPFARACTHAHGHGHVMKAAKASGKKQIAMTNDVADAHRPDVRAWFTKMRKAMQIAGARVRPTKDGYKSFPVFNKKNPGAVRVYAALYEDLLDIYADIIEDSGQDAFKAMGIADKVRFEVGKAGRKGRGVGVPINEHSKKWMAEAAGKLITQVTEDQRKALREVLSKAFDANVLTADVTKTIKRSIGLTSRFAGAVEKRRQTMLDSGMDPSSANAKADAYADRLLDVRAEMIARTETKDALEEGRLNAWQIADDEGLMPAGARKTWMAADHSPRLSDICDELDGQSVPLNESFYSEVLGEELDRPPAHPDCRSTLVLEFD